MNRLLVGLLIGAAVFVCVSRLASADADRFSWSGPDEKEKSWSALRAEISRLVASDDAEGIMDLIPQLVPFDTAASASFILKNLISHDDLIVHEESFHVLANYKSREAQKVVIETVANHKEWEMRAICVRALATYDNEFSFSKIEQALDDRKWQVRSSAIRVLGIKRRRSSVPLLIERLQTEAGRLREDIVWSLRRLTGQSYKAEYQDWMNWWGAYGENFSLPTEEELARNAEEGPRSLKTAVAEGLYGRIYSEKIAFIFDISGSMDAGTDQQGTRAEIATRELIRLLENGLTRKTYFNIIAFSEEAVPMRKRLVKASSAHIKKARKFLEKLEVGGETNVHAALKLAFDDPDVDTILLLSDGVPTLGDVFIPALIQQAVGEWNRDRRVIINCIGFFPGDAKHQNKSEAQDFLLNLAGQNEGYYKEIR